jgi:putative sterol carrier protein
LKNGNGKVSKATEGTPDATFEMIDADFISLSNKTLNPQQAFMQGKMKIKGNMAAAMKFNLDLFPPIPKL